MLQENIVIERQINDSTTVVGVGQTLWEAVVDGAEAEELAIEAGDVTREEVAKAPSPRVVSV